MKDVFTGKSRDSAIHEYFNPLKCSKTIETSVESLKRNVELTTKLTA